VGDSPKFLEAANETYATGAIRSRLPQRGEPFSCNHSALSDAARSGAGQLGRYGISFCPIDAKRRLVCSHNVLVPVI